MAVTNAHIQGFGFVTTDVGKKHIVSSLKDIKPSPIYLATWVVWNGLRHDIRVLQNAVEQSTKPDEVVELKLAVIGQEQVVSKIWMGILDMIDGSKQSIILECDELCPKVGDGRHQAAF